MRYNFDQIIDRHNTRSVKWDECDDKDVLPLWVADMDFATAPCVQEAIMRRAAHPCYGYTLVPDEYYDAIVGWFGKRHQWTIGRQQILYTIGVIPAINAVLKGICQTGDNIVMLTPVYNHFYSLVREAGCQAVEVCLTRHQLGGNKIGFGIDWDALEDALKMEKSTVLMFCNPHNPAGHVWDKADISRVVELCARHNVTIVSDEIHNEITAPGTLYNPLAPIAEAFGGDVKYVVCGSPSKSFNIAGLQNAFIVCPDDEMRRRIDRAINLNEVCDVNPFGVEALIAAYTEGAEWLDQMREYVYANYEYACEVIGHEMPDLAIADLQGTYLMWVDVSSVLGRLDISVNELCRRMTAEAKVWLCPGDMYGKGGENFVRINLACPRNTLAEALRRFSAFVK